jgi:site-specific DNA-methyltransferase (adenine-specific)/adenine-specific DNA-methyltransferase
MPTLDWIGKAAVVNHHRQVPYHLLRCDKALSAGDADAGNLLVQGDNLLALKALLPYYAGKVKCIYIDPPYNTGNENWVYNDNVNSPEIRRWIEATVGKEGEDLSRHDKWLCMMYPRLALLRDFLSEDGAILISIDDAEYQHLMMLMLEVFGPQNHSFTVIWQHSVQPKGYSGRLSIHHNYLVCFRKSDAFSLHDIARRDEHNVNYANPDNDPNGPWRSGDVRNALYRPNLIYDLKTPSGKIIKPPAKGWRWSKETMQAKIESGEISFRDDETKILRKIYLKDQHGRAPESIWFGEDVGTTRQANQELKEIFGGLPPFDTPKPIALIRRILEIASDKDSLILDSFAGSGTTGHAVLAQNKADGGNRRFITVEMDETICRDVTAQRIRKAIEGYGDTAGLGGGFRFCTLGAALFDDAGNIAGEVKFTDLAAHIFFTETGVPIPKRAKSDCPLLGVHNGKAVYLLFNGVLGDKRPAGGNVLTNRTLAALPKHAGPRIVYGEGCRLSASRLKREALVFKQVPYGIKVT